MKVTKSAIMDIYGKYLFLDDLDLDENEKTDESENKNKDGEEEEKTTKEGKSNSKTKLLQKQSTRSLLSKKSSTLQPAYKLNKFCVYILCEHDEVHIFSLIKNFLPKIVNIFLPIIFSICFGCSKEPSHRDDSFEYPQHMFWFRNKKIIFLLHTLN